MNPFKVSGKFDFKRFIISILIPEAVGFLSWFLTKGGMDKYKILKHPSFAPPHWLFSVVWPILYFLMGFALYRIWMRGLQGKDVKSAVFYFGSQLVFNFLWSIFYFRLGLRGIALIDLLILIIFVFVTTVYFFKIDKPAGYMMIPYLLWICFAAFLNYSVWQLNR